MIYVTLFYVKKIIKFRCRDVKSIFLEAGILILIYYHLILSGLIFRRYALCYTLIELKILYIGVCCTW